MNLSLRAIAFSASLLVHIFFAVALIALSGNEQADRTPIEVIDLTRSEISNLGAKAPPINKEIKKNIEAVPEGKSEATSDQVSSESIDEGTTPTEDSLITSPVKLVREFKISFTEEARKNNIDGPVVLELIINQAGKVHSVDLISGPGYGLNEAAMNAIKNFLFKPALIGEKPVAVKIRYTYRFKLNSQ